jgi:hypothetical protein
MARMLPFTLEESIEAARKATEQHMAHVEPLFLKRIVEDFQARMTMGDSRLTGPNNGPILSTVFDEYGFDKQKFFWERKAYQSAMGHLWQTRGSFIVQSRGTSSNRPKARREEESPYQFPVGDDGQRRIL